MMNKEFIIPLTTISVVFVLGLLSLYIFPVRPIPKPDGEFNIGISLNEYTDLSREELATDEKDKRRLLLDIWYPASTVEGNEPITWLREGDTYYEGIYRSHGIYEFLLQHTDLVKTNSYIDAPLLEEGPYPVIILSPGTPALSSLYYHFAEKLTSHGYVVVGMEQPYASIVVVFPDGEAVFYEREKTKNISNSDKENDETLRKVLKYLSYDIDSTLKYLEELNKGKFNGMLDLNNIGLMGHSGGGGIVLDYALNHDNINALLCLDPAIYLMTQKELSAGLDIPFMITMSEEWLNLKRYDKVKFLLEASRSKWYTSEIENALHADYAMIHYLSPLALMLNKTDTFMSRGGEEIIKELILAFFDENLKGKQRDLSNIVKNDSRITLYSSTDF
ncbi:MAG: hypothetical protein FXF54_11345 [Kosmotoga sp.]|nr:MAG: hypothetical protein FXF54_11345 [Kosmotoga sp.]